MDGPIIGASIQPIAAFRDSANGYHVETKARQPNGVDDGPAKEAKPLLSGRDSGRI